MSLSPRQDKFEKNLIINGNFDFWQRGANPSGASIYGADRWIGNSAQDSQNRTTRTTSTNMPDGAKYVNKFVSTGSAGASISQRIESNNTEALRGKTVIFSFKAAMFSGSTDIKVVIKRPTTTVDDWSASTQVYDSGTLGTPSVETSGYSSFEYSFLVTNDMAEKGFSVEIVGNAASAWQLYLSQAMLNEGTVAGSFSRAGRSISDELAMCQRYFEKSYDLADSPGTVTSKGAVIQAAINASGQLRMSAEFKVAKRVTGHTFVCYSPATGAANTVRDNNAGVDRTQIADNQGETRANISADGATANQTASAQWTSNAEL